MGNKVIQVVDKKGQLLGYSHHCPGCGHSHVYWTTPESNHHYKGKLVLWTFVNNNFKKPTFTASMLVNPDNDPSYKRCHYFVTDGKIRYLNDCTHHLKNQTIEMEDCE